MRSKGKGGGATRIAEGRLSDINQGTLQRKSSIFEFWQSMNRTGELVDILESLFYSFYSRVPIQLSAEHQQEMRMSIVSNHRIPRRFPSQQFKTCLLLSFGERMEFSVIIFF